MFLLCMPGIHGGDVSEQPSPMVLKEEKTLSANEVSGYMQSMFPEDAIRKCLSPISENARSRILMSQELSVYSNSEFAYAIFPIVIAFFWGKGVVELPNRNHCLRFAQF